MIAVTVALAGSSSNLARAEGLELFSATEAILKGCLESEAAIHHVVGPRSGLVGALFRTAQEESAARVLASHGCVVEAVPDSARAVAAAIQTAKSGRRAMALVNNRALDHAMPAIERLCRGRVEGDGAVCLLLEDSPERAPTLCPREAAFRLGLTVIEPADLGQLRDGVEQGMRLSRAGAGPTAVVVHERLLRAFDTLPCHPNRVLDRMDVALALRRRRRLSRVGEGGDLLRVARRYELNRHLGSPSPGERVPIGFIVAGPAAVALAHVLHDLRLSGRVPVLELGLLNPIDDAILSRMLSRVEQAVVLESRPGSLARRVLATAEMLRSRGERPGVIWWKSLPPAGDGAEITLEPGDALQPSTLVRKGIHLFHALRPALQVGTRLVQVNPSLTTIPVPLRSMGLGVAAMEADVRRRLVETDRWLREHTSAPESETPPSVLAIDGIEPTGPQTRIVGVEVWARTGFLEEGLAALRHAARTPRPRILIVIDLGLDDEPDVERSARAAVPRDRGERVRIVGVDLNEADALDEALRAAATAEAVTLLVIRDAPRPRYDVVALEQPFAEIDRLGFQPTQRLIWPADYACEMDGRPGAAPEALRRGETIPLRSEFARERLSRDSRSKAHLSVRPVLEQVEVVRTRAPRPAQRLDLSTRLAPPRLMHSRQGVWRAHLAGWRGPSPGAAAMLLSDAGRRMGFHVRLQVSTEPVAPGRRAWAQVLFTRPFAAETTPPLTSQIPYGEADLLLGVDPVETLRAIGPDRELRVADASRTFAVVNDRRLEDQLDSEEAQELAARLPDAIKEVAQAGSVVEPIAGACRDFFFSDRLTDIVAIGMAYQRGAIPVSVEAMEAAARALESRGFGRSWEAFQLGRRLAAEVAARADSRHDIEKLVRRTVLSISRGGWPNSRDADSFEHLLRSTLTTLIGHGELTSSPDVQREMVWAIYRCTMWGGVTYATDFVDGLLALLVNHPGPPGAALLRCALFPLAEAMLIRDLFFMSAMATSIEHRRRTRERLSVKLARGDQMERRYLNRVELKAFGYRYEVRFRSSDWPARVTAVIGSVIPRSWRGSDNDQMVREHIADMVAEAAAAPPSEAEAWVERLVRLHALARRKRMKELTVEAIEAETRLPPPVDAQARTAASPISSPA